MSTKAVIYTRVPVEGELIDFREALIYIFNNSYTYTRTYIDVGQSGYNLARPQLSQLTKNIDEDDLKLIVFLKVSDLSSNVSKLIDTIKIFLEKKVDIYFSDIDLLILSLSEKNDFNELYSIFIDAISKENKSGVSKDSKEELTIAGEDLASYLSDFEVVSKEIIDKK